MPTVQDIADYLADFAPHDLAAAWDNVGLLVGRGEQTVERVMTCLTVTPASAAEAVDEKAELVVAHHPMPFRPLKRLTDETPEGRMLLDLIGAGIAIYSPHTAFDSTRDGINQQLAEGLGLSAIEPLVPESDDPLELGSGRIGTLDAGVALSEFAETAKQFLKAPGVKIVGDTNAPVHRVAIACGSAGKMLDDAIDRQCDTLVLGETTFHTCLHAESEGVSLMLTGHYASERFAVEQLADRLAEQFPNTKVWASNEERDPVRWV
ncbi:MAG: Nif3-like dinuclear metal center hexameric protein [Pirellulales bacterium]|nr:Nif3-like dinuclear metal center hexameric protein [Pirellulales bacterium]